MAGTEFKAEIGLSFGGGFDPISFDFSISSGTSPSTGTIQVLAKRGAKESDWPSLVFEDLL